MTKPGIYKHYKGGTYRVLFTARNSSNGPGEGSIDVVYIDLKYGGLHTREEGQFHERVWIEGPNKGQVCTFKPEGELFKQTRPRFDFCGTMGNEMSDKDAAELWDDLKETFGRKDEPKGLDITWVVFGNDHRVLTPKELLVAEAADHAIDVAKESKTVPYEVRNEHGEMLDLDKALDNQAIKVTRYLYITTKIGHGG